MIPGSRSGETVAHPLARAIDCVRLPVPDIEAGLSFYRDALGHDLVWRSDTAAGLRLPGDEAELVVQTERPKAEVDLLVADAELAAGRFAEAGGRIVVEPFDVKIGRCVVVEDPWGNELVLIDARNGSLLTDAEGRVTGTTGAGASTASPAKV